jgi:hypothetical protein
LPGLAFEIAFWLNLGLCFGAGEGSTGPIVDTAFEVDGKFEGSLDDSEPMTRRSAAPIDRICERLGKLRQ